MRDMKFFIIVEFFTMIEQRVISRPFPQTVILIFICKSDGKRSERYQAGNEIVYQVSTESVCAYSSVLGSSAR